jgi:hypothetical protein
VLAAILAAALAADEAFGLQAIQEACHAGSLFDHPPGDLEGRESFVAGAAEYPHDVVLLQGDAVGLDHAGGIPADEVGRPDEGEKRLLGHRPEWTGLPELALESPLGHRGIR